MGDYNETSSEGTHEQGSLGTRGGISKQGPHTAYNYIVVDNGYGSCPYIFDGVSACPAWTGWAADVWTGKGIQMIHAATGYWNVPELVSPGHFNDYASTWIGVGGIHDPDQDCNGTGALLQAGTTSWTALGIVHYNMWYENTGDNPDCGNMSPDESVNAGDRIYAIIGCSGGPCDWVYLQDQTTGSYFGHDFGPNP